MVRIAALALVGLAALWVVGVSLGIAADDPTRTELVVVLVQAVAALLLQAYALRQLATGWSSMSGARRLGITLLGVVVAPVVLALGIVGAVVAVIGYGLLAVARRAGQGGGGARPGSGSAEMDRSRTGYDPPLVVGRHPAPPPEPRPCSMCHGRRAIQEYRPNPFPNEGQSLQMVACPKCGGRGVDPF
ncbi:hypothetical protein [Phycicoccus sp.]|uniref:hypothetical protein n=1 Tax=Phycicoccus sp. TaxID=1902410 RepID=UPI002C3081E3|nr:hypothetical protein [Phycicoccus sp.]HMM94391.1 hypothetical protein [Phycicoccus sp.]